jgi:hypothetical protein
MTAMLQLHQTKTAILIDLIQDIGNFIFAICLYPILLCFMSKFLYQITRRRLHASRFLPALGQYAGMKTYSGASLQHEYALCKHKCDQHRANAHLDLN